MAEAGTQAEIQVRFKDGNVTSFVGQYSSTTLSLSTYAMSENPFYLLHHINGTILLNMSEVSAINVLLAKA